MNWNWRRILAYALTVALLALAACSPPPAQKPAETAAPAAQETQEAQTTEGTPAAETAAEAAPALSELKTHAAFLFADERGFIRPEAALTGDELALALRSLGADAAAPTGAQPVTAQELRQSMSACLSAEALAAFPTEGEVSRAAFAVGVCAALGTGEGEAVSPAEGARSPVDLPMDAPYAAAVLEACVPHEPTGDGGWAESAPETGYAPGALWLDGAALRVGEDGRLLINADYGPLHFDQTGRYTSGDEELDAYVDEILQQFCTEHPEDANDPMALLRHAYDYAMAYFRYVGRGGHTDEDGWEIALGKAMLETGRGDCYDYAAGFTVLARGLGFPANCIIKSLDSPENLHTWTDIVIDGVPYIFDPQLEKHFNNDRFMLKYKFAARYGYQRPLDAPGELHESFQDVAWTEPTERGTLETTVSDEGLSYLVYLPCGYDESKQYNVLIYPYGADGDPYKMLGTSSGYAHQNRYLGRYITTPAFVDFLVQRGDCGGLILAACNTAMTTGQGERYVKLLQYVVDNYSTYAESSAVEDLVAAREHFALAGPSSASQGICITLREMPDCFETIGLFSGVARLDEAEEGLRMKDHLYLVMGVGEQESMLYTVESSYERFAQIENVDASLYTFPDSSHEWSAFDGALRELLFRFSPAEDR